MQIKGFEHFKLNFVELIVNNSCPLNCTYCFLQNRGEADNMSEETLHNVYIMCKKIQEINPQPFISIMYGLKEPMMSFNRIKNVLDNLDFDPLDYKIFSTMNTNGVLITDDIFYYCQDHNIDLHISLDGPKDINDRGRIYRGHKDGSSWEVVMDLIRRHPNAPYMSLMATIHKQDILRIKEIFHFMSNLPVTCWVYALNKFDDWDDKTLETLERGIKEFINEATPQQLSKTRFVNTAAISTNINVINGLKVEQDGTVSLQPPVGGTDGQTKGAFTSKVILGNVNTEVTIPKELQDKTLLDYEIIGPHCSDSCPLYKECKRGTIPIYIDDFSCRRVQHFNRMATYAQGGKMTDEEYKKIRNTYPIYNAVINLTDNCNLRCPYCFTEHNTRNIDLGTMKAAIHFILSECDRFPDFKGKPGFAFFGGEPMLRFNDIIVPTLEWVKETGLQDKYHINWSMTTNGTLFTPENIKYLSDNNVSILLSIDGDKYTQDDQRPGANGQSSFDMIDIPLILKYYPTVTFRSAVEPRNAIHMLENYLFARNAGFMNYFITPNLYANWTDEDIKTALAQLALIAQVIYNDIKNGYEPCKWNEFFVSIRNIFENKKEPNEITYNHCGIGTNSCGIATNGDINGCQEHNTYLNHDIFYIGNIFTGIDPIRHKRLLEEYKSEKHPICVDNPDRCKTCDFYNDCASHFCPSHNILNGGAIKNSLVTCAWKNFMYNLALMWLDQADTEGDKNVIEYIKRLVLNGQNNYSIW